MDYLEFAPMTEEEMIAYLGELESLEKKLPKLCDDAFRNVETLEESISRNSFHRPDPSDGGSRTGNTGDTVYLTLMAVYRDMERQQRESAQDILKYTKAQEKLAYVKRCISLLPSEQSELIEAIYIKKTTFKAFAVEKHISSVQTGRRARQALEQLLEVYNARFSKKDEGEEEDP